MDDLISRQMAIAVPERLIKDCNPDHFVGHQKFIEFMDDAEIGSFGNWQFANGFNLGLTAAEVEIEKLLSVQPKWISVTERLPEIDMSHPHHEDYLVQYDSGGIDVASWSNINRFWTDHVTEPHWNCVQFAKVIAWMPLPEPYRRGEEE